MAKTPCKQLTSIVGRRTTLYSNSTFVDHVGQEITLSHAPIGTMIEVMLYTTAMSSANRTILLIPANLGIAAFYAVATSATDFDILRIDQDNNKFTLISHRNTAPITIGAIYDYYEEES